MVFIKPDIEAGTVDGNHADVLHPPVVDHHEDETDEEPDVEDIEVVNNILIDLHSANQSS